MGTWIKCSERLPDKEGIYRVIRKSFPRGRREDRCEFSPVGAQWRTRGGQKLNGVEEWNEEAGACQSPSTKAK